jgi:hypothetical protein
MPSTYTTNLGLEKPATGEQAGTWGVTANLSYDFLDMATDGNVSIALSSSSYTLTTSQGVDSSGRNKVIEFTGTLSANATIFIAPNTARKIYFIRNHTSGGFSLVIQPQGGTGPTFTLQAGHSAIVYADGLGAAAGVRGFTSDLQTDTLLVITSLTVQGSQSFAGVATFGAAATFSGGVTISPSLILNLGSDAPYDLYYRSAAGGVARLANGAAGQLLEATASGPKWATVSMSIGIGTPLAGAVANLVLFADGSGNIAQNSAFHWGPGQGLGIGVVPGHPLHVGGGLAPEGWFDGPSGTAKRIVYATGGNLRAYFGVTGAAETGLNAGSNLLVATNYDDNSIGWIHLEGYRNTGHTAIGLGLDLGGVLNVSNPGSPMPVSTPILVVRGIGGQTGDLQDWQNSAGTNVARVDANGGLTVASMAISGGFSVSGTVSAGGFDTHGAASSGNYGVYDTGGSHHDGFTGQISVPGGGSVNCIKGIIVLN